ALTAVEESTPESSQCGRPRFFPWLNKSKINRITGGWEAKPFSLPWMASIQFHFRERLIHLCGGSIICLNACNTTDSVLSAAHCAIQNGKILPPNQMIVVAGTHDFKLPESNTRQIIPVKSYRDAGYEAKSGRHDLLIVKLVRNIRFSHYVQPVCLPSRKEVLTIGTLCFVAGWGKTTELGRTELPSRLSMADVYVRRMQNCKQHFGLAASKKLQICASGNEHRSTCTVYSFHRAYERGQFHSESRQEERT
ncbi:hypothetical protein M514_01524, partial [Trichuris suis]